MMARNLKYPFFFFEIDANSVGAWKEQQNLFLYSNYLCVSINNATPFRADNQEPDDALSKSYVACRQRTEV